MAGHLECLEFLLKNGAKVDAPNEIGSTSLLLATWKGQPEAVELLLKHGANVDAQNEAGNTALMTSVSWSKRQCARILLDYGASPDIKNNKGKSPRSLAVGDMRTLIEEHVVCSVKPAKT
mmetsp:Transcript_3439/g.4482  ORF Transcript_3439/g.4482 Transcript_3439/m.4482 type:complete len:120 (+) Transcript_3439:37-396(+)